MGELLSPIAKRLVGVDVSEKMLAKASEKKFYDDLLNKDIDEALSLTQEQFDLVVAADVFVYCGKLESIFRQAVKVMTEGGWFAFTVEEVKDKDYFLQESGRFGHSDDYISLLCKENHLQCGLSEEIVLRMHRNKPLHGRLYLLQKM